MRSDMSNATTECVRAPHEMKETPVEPILSTVCKVTFPLASVSTSCPFMRSIALCSICTSTPPACHPQTLITCPQNTSRAACRVSALPWTQSSPCMWERCAHLHALASNNATSASTNAIQPRVVWDLKFRRGTWHGGVQASHVVQHDAVDASRVSLEDIQDLVHLLQRPCLHLNGHLQTPPPRVLLHQPSQ